MKLPVFLTWRLPHLLEKTNKAMLAWLGHRDLSLATARSCASMGEEVHLDGFWREPPLGSLNQTLSQERNLDYRMARHEKRPQRRH